MSRTPVTVRCADLDDVPVLREIWLDVLRPGDRDEQLNDVRSIVEACRDDDDRRIAVALYDGEVAGAVYLEASTLTPLNLEPTVLTVSPHVLPRFRRKGVGSVLIEAATQFAEKRDIATVASAAHASSRDANRFMARLALSPQATLRAASTAAVRAKLSARNATSRPRRSRQVDRVLAARRLGREHMAS